MFIKFISCVILLVFCYVQIGSSLNCLSCNGPADCKSQRSIECTNATANASTNHLHTFFTANLSNVVSLNFDCFQHNYTSSVSGRENVTYKGCVYRNIEPCSLSLKTEYNYLKKEKCEKCSGNNCNPAGSFSSSMFTLFASILALCLYKAAA